MKIYLDDFGIMPTRAHATDAGLDLMTPIDFDLWPRESEIVDTGVHVSIPHGCVGFLKSKSGLYTKSDIISEGVIDAGYSGSIKVKLCNVGERRVRKFKAGDKITQLVILPIELPEVELVDEEALKKDCLSCSDRKDGGFGSTGK